MGLGASILVTRWIFYVDEKIDDFVCCEVAEQINNNKEEKVGKEMREGNRADS